MPSTRIPLLPRRAYQRTDAVGFKFARRNYNGFTDRRNLPIEVRQQVARWAVATGSATPEQRQLLQGEAEGEESARPGMLDLLHLEAELLKDQRFQEALAHLTEDQQEQILHPHAILDRTFVWPLRVKDAATVLGDVTENQLRDWDNAGVCKPVRTGSGSYRGYFRSQLLLARLISLLVSQGYTLERIREDLGLSPKPAAATDVVAVSTAMAADYR